jgi:predicted ATPase
MVRGSTGEGAEVDLRAHLVFGSGRIHSVLCDMATGVELARGSSDTDLAGLKGPIPKDEVGRASLGRELANLAIPDGFRVVAGRLWLDLSDELKAVPWELMYIGGHVALGSQVHLIRFAGGSAEAPLPGMKPHVLVVHANPCSAKYPNLEHAEREYQSICRALDSAECGRFQVSSLKNATVASLIRAVEECKPNVLHFVGHGDLLPSGGALVLEGANPKSESILYCEELGELLLRSGTTMAVLSGCMTAGVTAAIGSQLAERAVNLVVGMQMPIEDASAPLFARAMYAAIAEGTRPYEAVRQGRTAISRSGMDWAAPVIIARFPLRSPFEQSRQIHNLPIDDRPFIGRIDEKRELVQLIKESQLTTVTGMGGMGKTRLAREVARDVLDDFGAVWLVECEALENREEVVLSLAGVLGVESSATVEQDVIHAIGNSPLLLVFDCFERVAEAAADFLDRVLARCPSVKIVVTSRVVLGLARETEFVLGPMSLKGKRSALPDGLDLFLKAATRVDRDFKLTRKNRAPLIGLVQALESVPLAIILAAGRLRHMGLDELHQQVLTQRLDVLKRKPVGQDRHADLLRVVGDSFALLGEEELSLIQALSVFRGGFYLHDAQAVLGQSPQLLDGIATLRDNSLLVVQQTTGAKRYRILDTIREYIERTFEETSLAESRARHAEYFVAQATAVRDLVEKGRWTEANARLWMDIGNYRGAIEHAARIRNSDQVRQLAGSLARICLEAGAKSDFELMASQGEQFASEHLDFELLVELRGLQGTADRRSGDFIGARTRWLERVEFCRQIGDLDGECDTLLDLADLALSLGEMDRVEAMLARFRLVSVGLSPGPIRASGLLIEAKAALERGEVSLALEFAEAAERMTESLGVGRHALYVWMSLAQIQRRTGNIEKSAGLCRRMLSDALASSFHQSAGMALLELAKALEELGDLSGAAEAILISAEIPRSVSPALKASCLVASKEFAAAHGEGYWEEGARRLEGRTWTVLATELASHVNSPSV